MSGNILKQLEKMRNTCSRLFTSKLLYGIQLYSNVWGLNAMDDSTRRFKAFTKEDLRHLQVLQIKMLRIILKNPDQNTPTSTLLLETKDLTVDWIELVGLDYDFLTKKGALQLKLDLQVASP